MPQIWGAPDFLKSGATLRFKTRQLKPSAARACAHFASQSSTPELDIANSHQKPKSEYREQQQQSTACFAPRAHRIDANAARLIFEMNPPHRPCHR